MVEFAVSVVGLLIIAAFVIDGCLLVHRYSLLTDSTAELTRHLASRTVQTPLESTANNSPARCSELVCRSLAARDAFLSSASYTQGFSFAPTIIGSGGDLQSYAPYPLIRVEGTAAARCILCSVLPWALTLRSTSVLVIESAQTGCNDDGEYTACQ